MLNIYKGFTKAAKSYGYGRFFSTSSSSVPHYDIVISGCGMNGAALACALSYNDYFRDDPKRILVVDAAPKPSFEDFKTRDHIPDQRVVTLTHSSADLFRQMGVWENLNHERVSEINQMQVWEIGGTSHIKFNDNPAGQLVGYGIENRHLLATLVDKVEQLGACQLELEEKITDVKFTPNEFVKINLEKKGEVTARLVVGSDGPNSIVKRKAQVPSYGWSSDQFGIVCTVKTSHPNKTAWQRFLSSGPLAILPLFDDYNSIVWSCEPTLYDHLMKVSDEQFLDELNYNLSRQSHIETPNFVFNDANFEHPPIVQELCNKRLSFPLKFLQANRYVGERFALIGDAAHTVHPLAGQGLNLGLLDVNFLANNITRNVKAGHDFGSESLLEEYERKSKVVNYTWMAGLEGIKRSYESNTFDPFVFARNAATTVLNNFTPAKWVLNEVASGKAFSKLGFGVDEYEWKSI